MGQRSGRRRETARPSRADPRPGERSRRGAHLVRHSGPERRLGPQQETVRGKTAGPGAAPDLSAGQTDGFRRPAEQRSMRREVAPVPREGGADRISGAGAPASGSAPGLTSAQDIRVLAEGLTAPGPLATAANLGGGETSGRELDVPPPGTELTFREEGPQSGTDGGMLPPARETAGTPPDPGRDAPPRGGQRPKGSGPNSAGAGSFPGTDCFPPGERSAGPDRGPGGRLGDPDRPPGPHGARPGASGPGGGPGPELEPPARRGAGPTAPGNPAAERRPAGRMEEHRRAAARETGRHPKREQTVEPQRRGGRRKPARRRDSGALRGEARRSAPGQTGRRDRGRKRPLESASLSRAERTVRRRQSGSGQSPPGNRAQGGPPLSRREAAPPAQRQSGAKRPAPTGQGRAASSGRRGKSARWDRRRACLGNRAGAGPGRRGRRKPVERFPWPF